MVNNSKVIYKSGTINKFSTTTQGQQKKFITQMNDLEKQMIFMAVKNFNLNKMIISPHLKEKMLEKGITFGVDLIKKTIKEFTIEKNLLECNYNADGSTRILIKSHDTFKVEMENEIKECVICFVINLKNHHLATVYWNTVEFSKRIPNLRNYNRRLDILTHLKPYIN